MVIEVSLKSRKPGPGDWTRPVLIKVNSCIFYWIKLRNPCLNSAEDVENKTFVETVKNWIFLKNHHTEDLIDSRKS